MIGLLTGKQVLGYMGMPRLKARLEDLFLTGFQFIAYFMALVYSAVKLLPAGHPYTNIQNKGKFGIRHVIAAAANNLVLKKENADQIALFTVMLIGIVLIFVQILLLVTGIFMQPVFAAMPTNFAGFFLTPAATETTDVAHIMLDLVFGAVDGSGTSIFNSCVAQGITCLESPLYTADPDRQLMADSAGNSIYTALGFPFPIHTAMHQMFQLYNIGLLVVAAFISLYFMVTVVAETAQTGTAFGRRFNKVWAPLRIVFAFGLLIPVGIGFNASQWIVLYAAKFGSGFATNGWTYFNTTLTDGYFADSKDLVSQPNIPEIGTLLQFMYTARTCKWLEDWSTINSTARDIQMYMVKGSPLTGVAATDRQLISLGDPYQDLIDFAAGSSNVRIRFGQPHTGDKYEAQLGGVFPFCGELIFKLSDSRVTLLAPTVSSGDINTSSIQQEVGLHIIQESYWNFILNMWFEVFDNGGAFSLPADNYPQNIVINHTNWDGLGTTGPQPEPDSAYRSQLIDIGRLSVEAMLLGTGPGQGAIIALQNSPRYNPGALIAEKGWAGAAIWYNRIAEMNGAVTSATLNIPFPSLYPAVMEHIYKEKKLRNAMVDFQTRFHPQIRDSDPVAFREPAHAEMAPALWEAYNYWQAGNGGATPHAAPTGNAMIDAINALFGTEGLYNIRRNPDAHPVAQIVGVGRGLIESAIRNLTLSVVGGVSGNILKIFGDPVTQAAAGTTKILSTFLITVTMVGLTAGFVLFYVVPFLPFIYFFFAVGGWIKGIFEAMVGAPLWALAHIRIDQEGLPGQAGIAGYFLIFEIFLRPILIIFGMLASISIFSALVSTLNQVFDLITANLGGFDYRSEVTGTAPQPVGGAAVIPSTIESARGAIDEFFFTVLYTVIIYLMAMSSFKLIDHIPNNILRWMGQSTATFNDQREDAAQSLVGKATVGSQQTSGALGKGLQSLVR